MLSKWAASTGSAAAIGESSGSDRPFRASLSNISPLFISADSQSNPQISSNIINQIHQITINIHKSPRWSRCSLAWRCLPKQPYYGHRRIHSCHFALQMRSLNFHRHSRWDLKSDIIWPKPMDAKELPHPSNSVEEVRHPSSSFGWIGRWFRPKHVQTRGRTWIHVRVQAIIFWQTSESKLQ